MAIIFFKYFIKFVSRLVIFLIHCLALFGVIFYTHFEYSATQAFSTLADCINLLLIYQHLDSFFFTWLSEKAPLNESVWVVNKGAPLFLFTCVEIYLLLLYFGYLWEVKPVSTKTKLNKKHRCSLRFWLGFQNSCFSVIISWLFTINSFLAAVSLQFGVLIIICFAFTMVYFVVSPIFVKIPDYFSPAIGVGLANFVTLYLYLWQAEFSQYARMLWLAQLICVCGACLLFLGLALFNIRPSLPSSFTRYIAPQIQQNATESVKDAISHKYYLNHYLAAINMPKLWLLISQFIQYTYGLLGAEIALVLNLIFLLICVLTSLAFLPAIGYTQTSMYSLLPPISFWLRFEVSTKHYFQIIWLSYLYYATSKTVKFPFLYLVAAPYNYQYNDTLKTILEANTYFVFGETNNPNNITYRCLTNITGVLFQVVLAYYLLGLNII